MLSDSNISNKRTSINENNFLSNEFFVQFRIAFKNILSFLAQTSGNRISEYCAKLQMKDDELSSNTLIWHLYC